jgi:DNA-binding HxlR family transcriptional regulator
MTADRCPTFQATIELVGRRWNGAVIMAANSGARRFSEFRAAIPEISERLLAQRLHELEDAGIVVREVIAARPVQIFYSLSRRGKELVAALEPLIGWGERWREGAPDD